LLELLETCRSSSERILCRALIALASAAIGDDDAARRLARQAISQSARPPSGLRPEELLYLRRARVLASNASQLVGDMVRGRRAAQARFVRGDPASMWLATTTAGTACKDAPSEVRCYGCFTASVHAAYAARPRFGPLTPAEIAVLQLVASGMSAPQAAAALGRSTHTVRTHLRNAYAKLGAHGRTAALAKARALGLLSGDDC
jgi:LuxR family maltose regulon positive regulatory protein